VVATVAPVLASVVLFAVTRSPYTLVFALLGPVVAIGSLADSAWQRRRSRSVEATRFDAELVRANREIDEAHAAERAALDQRYPRAIGLATARSRSTGSRRDGTGSDLDGVGRVRLGSGSIEASVTIEGLDAGHERELDPRLAELRVRARELTNAPIASEIRAGIAIVGSGVGAMAAARGIVIQLAAGRNPATTRVTAPADAAWDWLVELPHVVTRTALSGLVEFTDETATVAIVLAESGAHVAHGVDAVVVIAADGVARVDEGTSLDRDLRFGPEFVGLEAARRAAAAIAERFASMARASGIPTELRFADVPPSSEPGGLGAAIGMDAAGPVTVDLARSGPHAIVGGTTGSGKSELLVSWVLAIAAERSPALVTFLFVDFKGGAAFEPLAQLPHSVGIITDLDATGSLRALASLGAELRFRERRLAEHGLRSIDDAAGNPPFPRLVVMVDEYAALVETHSSLHGVFADIAARGRSLGVHLVLCTQRPTGVVRDGILANCALRISLRVLTAADSVSVIGTDAAAALTTAPPGRALVASAGSQPAPLQVAHASAPDVASVSERWVAIERPRRPWLPPLPRVIPLESIAGHLADDGIPFALADLPEQQAQELAVYRPQTHGSMLVVGATGSGKSSVLSAMLAAPSATRVVRVPGDLPRLWDALAALDDARGESERVLLLDDLDLVISSCEDGYQQALLDSLGRVLRSGRASGTHLVLTVQRVSGAVQSLAALCGSTLVLRMPNQQEHVLAGGSVGDFSADAAPGSGIWRGHRLQVLDAPPEVPQPDPLRATLLAPDRGALTVVSTRPEAVAEQLRAAAPARTVIVLGPTRFDASQSEDPALRLGDPPILVADPETWQGHWSTFVTALRFSSVLFDGCSPTELRTLTRTRDLPPPFPRGERPLWLLTSDGSLMRARLPGAPGEE
jgi:S-DNA-T family DNA segregation ATPase FtsK/SpoIIIE